jgi:hypothetical protein
MDSSEFDFNRSGIFYPAIMTYWVLLHGTFELLSRGFIRIIEGSDANAPGMEDLIAKAIADTYADPADRHVTKMFDEPQLLTTSQPERITPPDADAISYELFASHAYILGPLLAGWNLLIAGYQAAQAAGYTDKTDPTWEFLRHCRNGAAHNGRFKLRHGEPRRPARWRGVTIASDLDGAPVFRNLQGEGVLALGDPLLLLLDLEKANPQMTAQL